MRSSGSSCKATPCCPAPERSCSATISSSARFCGLNVTGRYNIGSSTEGDGVGDWGAEPWANDEAADWFHRFWTKSDFALLINEINNFDERDERDEKYDSLKAAGHVLQTMGNPYIWPAQHLAVLKDLLDTSIRLLENCRARCASFPPLRRALAPQIEARAVRSQFSDATR
jgi:hypothetical protein